MRDNRSRDNEGQLDLLKSPYSYLWFKDLSQIIMKKRFNFHVWCSDVACYADIESYT